MVSFLRSSGSPYRDLVDPGGTMAFGDGSPAGLVLIPRTVLANICQQAAARAHTAVRGNTEVGGLLIGPASQTNHLLLENAIPLGVEYQFGPGLAKLLDPIRQAKALHQPDGTTRILGFYRILRKSYRKITDGDLEILTDIRSMHPSFSGLRCCFLVPPVVTSQILFHVLICNGRTWEEIQQVVYQMDPAPDSTPLDVPTPSTLLTPDAPATELDTAVRVPRTARQAAKSLEPDPRARRRRVVAFAASILLVLAALGGAVAWMIEKRGLSYGASRLRLSSPAAMRTGFSANPEGSAWKLTWDSGAVMALKPTDVVVSISDGADQQNIALRTADLSSGAIYYNPRGGELAFTLRVLSNGATLIEDRVRVLQSFLSVGRPPNQFQNSEIQVPRHESRGGLPGSTLALAGSITMSPAQQAPAAVTGTFHRRSKIRNFRIFQPPSLAPGTSTQTGPILTDAPPIATRPISQPAMGEFTSTFTAPPAP